MTWKQLNNYTRYVVRHKYFVFKQGQMLHVPLWRLLIHDWSKFLPDEFMAYMECFNAPDGTPRYLQTEEFAVAWNKHQKRNDHHFQHWILTWDSGKVEALEMPYDCANEMVADWSGANLSSGGNGSPRPWLDKKIADGTINLHPLTLVRVNAIIDFYWGTE